MQEPIIIDGVNVSGCLFRGTNRIGNDIGTYCRLFTGSCKKQNCCYKQLQRKTQTCKKLQREIKHRANTENSLDNLCTKLESENLSLKEELTALSQTYEACEIEYKSLYNRYKDLLNKYNELKEAQNEH